MGNSIQTLSDTVKLIASNNTWIESESIRQLHFAASLEDMKRVVGMPDLHPGNAYPVGAAFFSENHIYPILTGTDIGCGIALWQTTLNATRIHADKLDKKWGNMDYSPDADELPEETRDFSRWILDNPSLGTLGGGNHFAELQRLDTVYDESAVQLLQLDKKQVFLLIHSGSRHLGYEIFQQASQASPTGQGLLENTPACETYLAQHEKAIQFGYANRTVVAHRILSRLNARGKHLLDIPHNFISRESIDGKSGWLHRKGAGDSRHPYGIIPGSRGDFSWLIQPIANEELLFSFAHGAGRKWARKDCRGRLERRYTVKQMHLTKLGSHVICQDDALLYEEAPEAYKSAESVVHDLVDAGVAKIIARFRPVLTYKTRRNK